MTRGAKISWAVIVGMFLLLLALSSGGSGVQSGSVLVLNIGGPVTEQKPDSGFFGLLAPKVLVLHRVTDAIDRAAKDDRITGLVVRVQGPDAGWAKLQEIRSHIIAFRKSAKPSVCFLSGDLVGNREYYLASACDQVWLMPSSPLGLTGLMSESLFIRGTLDKLKVYPDFYGIEEYKTARNFYTEKKYTAAHREMVQALIGSVHKGYIADVAAARRTEPAFFERCLADGPFISSEALERKLIDKTAYWDEVTQFFADKNSDKKWKPVELQQYSGDGPELATQKIAVVHATGTIIVGNSESDPSGDFIMGSESVSRDLRAARDDDAVKAIILRVDSPGGSAVASEIIRREVLLAQKKKPVVVSMSDVAGSGGYWIAMSANKIVADPATITGSIGVVFGKMNISGLYDLVGLSTDRFYTSENATFLSPQQNFTPQQREVVQRFMRQIYDDFTKGVAEGRKMKVEEVNRIGRGRVWTGTQGKENGLVDEIGGFDRALALAKELAHIGASERVAIVRYPQEKSFWKTLLESSSESEVQSLKMSAFIAKVRKLAAEPPAVQARMPFELTIR